MKLSAIILTNRNSKDIQSTADSVAFADEIIVWDGRAIVDFASARNRALAKAKGDWVLFVDDDETISKQLAWEVIKAIDSNKYVAYYLSRRDLIVGQALKYGETGQMKIIRLARKTAGKFVRPVHEVWRVSGSVGELKNPLFHHKENFISAFIDRIAFYGPIDALALKKEGKSFTLWRLMLYPKIKFCLNYFLRLGFLDGYLGLFHAYLMSVQSLSVRVFQWQEKSFSK